MTAEAKTIPEDIRRAARSALFDAIRDKRVGMTIKMTMAGLSEEAFVDAIATAIHDAVMAERDRCARLIEEGYERGIARKMDMCAHSKFKWEDCDECAVAAIRAAPKAER